MALSKRVVWSILLVVAIAGAIALNDLLLPRSWYSSSSPYQAPYASENYEPATAETAASFRVELPANYRDRLVQYVTVDCPNSRIVRKMFVNPEALAALRTNNTPPSGTVLMMETHSAQPDSDGRLRPTQLNNVFVREKRDGWQVNENSGDWRSAWYSPQGSLVSNSQSSCIGCHTRVRDRDYLFTLPALLTAANTGQRQYQETEFRTSVCR
ncbi:MAG: cytochrome P460 family protein [Leptolyngbya sp. SIOISBB]|nr:cytochrome P460 family protein [Leptolyngbya sp. SIOISBB]